jgi:hypothetical protein
MGDEELKQHKGLLAINDLSRGMAGLVAIRPNHRKDPCEVSVEIFLDRRWENLGL